MRLFVIGMLCVAANDGVELCNGMNRSALHAAAGMSD